MGRINRGGVWTAVMGFVAAGVTAFAQQPLLQLDDEWGRAQQSDHLWNYQLEQSASAAVEAVDTVKDLITPAQIDCGTILVGTCDTVTFALHCNYRATQPVVISSLAIIGSCASSYLLLDVPPKLPDTLAPGASLQLRVGFCATQQSPCSASLRITSGAAGGSTDVPISGAGAAPQLRIEGVLFGAVRVGSCRTRALRMTNYGNAVATICSIAIEGADSGAFAITGNTPITIQPFASASVDIRFCPTAIGPLTDTVRVTVCSPVQVARVGIIGAGGGIVGPATVDFGAVAPNQIDTIAVLLRNETDSELIITSLQFTGADAGAFTTDLVTPQRLPIGSTCDPDVALHAPGLPGPVSARLELFSQGLPCGSVDLKGTVLQNAFTVAPIVFADNVVFGAVAFDTIHLNNLGALPRTVSSISLSGIGQSAYRIVAPLSWPFTMNGQSNEMIIVRFDPASPGSYLATLQLALSDSTQFSVALSGTSTVTGVRDVVAPSGLSVLHANHPNPFSDETVITYSLAERSNASLIIRDAVGRVITTIEHGMQESGTHAATFRSDGLPAGPYVCELRAGGAVLRRGMVVVR